MKGSIIQKDAVEMLSVDVEDDEAAAAAAGVKTTTPAASLLALLPFSPKPT